MEAQEEKKTKRQLYMKEYDAERYVRRRDNNGEKFVKDPFKNKITEAIKSLPLESLKIEALIKLIRTKEEYVEIREKFEDDLIKKGWEFRK